MNSSDIANAGLSAGFITLVYLVYQCCSFIITHPWRCRSRCCCSADDAIIEFDEPTPPEFRRPNVYVPPE